MKSTHFVLDKSGRVAILGIPFLNRILGVDTARWGYLGYNSLEFH